MAWLVRDLRVPALAALLLAPGCRQKSRPASDAAAPARGAALVAGAALDEWGFLAVPRAGGRAQLRALSDPRDSLWSGRARLPPAAAARAVGEGTVLLRTPGGDAYRYDPGADVLVGVGRLQAGWSWASFEGYGVCYAPGSFRLLVVGPGTARSRTLARPVLWASPVGEEEVAVLVGSPGEPALWLLKAGETEPVGAGRVAVAPSGLAMAWGRRLVFVGADSASVVFVTVPGLTEVDRVSTGGPIVALAASPSSHEVYVATGRPSRLLALNRFTLRVRELAEFDTEVREIRPSLLGGSLLVRDGQGAAFVPLGGGEPVRLEADWRPDLPLGLPGGWVLAAAGEQIFLWKAERPDEPEPLPVPGDAWWIPLRWRPTPPALAARPVGGLPGEEGTTATGAAGPGTPEGPRGGPESAGVPGGGGGGTPGAEAAGAARVGSEIATGFYAVVASSQEPAGILGLTRRLREVGFPTTVQRHRDEANEVWYRALVGPYDTRGDAEAAARQLRRERGLQAWIAEIGPEIGGGTGRP